MPYTLTENEKQEIYKSIAMLAQTLSKSIEKAKNFSDSDYSSLLHTIPITEDILFEKEKDHYVIKSMFIPMLKLLNLSLIDFTNVDIRCIDFRETNATIDLTKIYNKDASFCTFEDGNIPDWKDYRGVNLTGATLGEDIHTMVGLNGAIVDEKTSFKTR